MSDENNSDEIPVNVISDQEKNSKSDSIPKQTIEDLEFFS